MEMAFKTLRKALSEAPTLAFLDIHKSFYLYVDEREGIAQGVLTQTLGKWKGPMTYLSRKLDSVT
jgi:hypothetical protein